MRTVEPGCQHHIWLCSRFRLQLLPHLDNGKVITPTVGVVVCLECCAIAVIVIIYSKRLANKSH